MALSVTLGFHAQFTASKVGKTGLTPTIDIKSIKKSDGTIAAVVTGGSTTPNWRGVYFYLLTGADPETYDYEAVFITADATVDQKEVPALWTQFSVAVQTASGKVSEVVLTDTLTTLTGMTASDVGAIKAKTDNLPAAPADESLVIAATNAILTQATTAATQSTAAATSAASADNKASAIQTTLGAAGAGLTAVKLAATGLDAIAITDPGPAASITTFPKALVWLFRRFFKKAVLDSVGGTVKTYGDDNATVNVTQTITDTGTVQTQGPAT